MPIISNFTHFISVWYVYVYKQYNIIWYVSYRYILLTFTSYMHTYIKGHVCNYVYYLYSNKYIQLYIICIYINTYTSLPSIHRSWGLPDPQSSWTLLSWIWWKKLIAAPCRPPLGRPFSGMGWRCHQIFYVFMFCFLCFFFIIFFIFRVKMSCQWDCGILVLMILH